MGATINHILWLFGKEFLRLIVIAFAIAAPLAWWMMDDWLQNFKFRIDVGIWVFVLAVTTTVVIAIKLGVSSRTVYNYITYLREELQLDIFYNVNLPSYCYGGDRAFVLHLGKAQTKNKR
ncbi:MAG: hypothetical protein HC880_01890 [Bacteroidia bacterium]|nr:hypothetical protein [Bacteroidia bacterium]